MNSLPSISQAHLHWKKYTNGTKSTFLCLGGVERLNDQGDRNVQNNGSGVCLKVLTDTQGEEHVLVFMIC